MFVTNVLRTRSAVYINRPARPPGSACTSTCLHGSTVTPPSVAGSLHWPSLGVSSAYRDFFVAPCRHLLACALPGGTFCTHTALGARCPILLPSTLYLHLQPSIFSSYEESIIFNELRTRPGATAHRDTLTHFGTNVSRIKGLHKPHPTDAHNLHPASRAYYAPPPFGPHRYDTPFGASNGPSHHRPSRLHDGHMWALNVWKKRCHSGSETSLSILSPECTTR